MSTTLIDHDISLEPLRLDDATVALLHRWVTHPRSVYWMMTGSTPAEVRAEYARIEADPHHHAWLGKVGGRPLFLAETYDPAHADGMTDLPELRSGDLGMHVLVAPPEAAPVPGLTTRVFDAVMAFCFADPGVQRVVVEPDVRNAGIRAKNLAAGFTELREIAMPDKTAMLSVCSRADWDHPDLVRVAGPHTASGAPTSSTGSAGSTGSVGDHLTPEVLDRAQRHLVAKAIGEYAHERLLAPVPDPSTADAWTLETGGSSYSFVARRHALEHWVVDAASIRRTLDGRPVRIDAQELVVELAPVLGIPDELLPTYLEEIAATLAAGAWKLTHRATPVAELVDADYQRLEASMTEGHPAFVANNGRIGFSLDDYRAYAPEAGEPVRLEWLAARAELCAFHGAGDVDEQSLYDAELTPALRAEFEQRLRGLGLDPADYRYLPVHPWQWQHKVAVTFAPDVARRDLVHLGPGVDDHKAQQSIRTFFNTTRPERHYVKTALAIQNMGFVRGLSPAYMEATPAINDWMADVVHHDPELVGCAFEVLREVAAVGYTGDAFHRLETSSPYRKMLAALWRESPMARMAEGEQLATMAALLHRDADGDALVTAWIKASPLDAEDWVRAYLGVYLRPLVHLLHAHEIAVMPHGENLVLRMRDHAPVGAFYKDIGEEMAVMGDQPLPEAVERIRGSYSDEVKALAIHTDVFDGVLRFLGAILAEDGMLDDATFWGLVRECLADYAADHPELADRIARFDLLRPTFRHSCLNRLQLRNTLQMVDLTDQAESLIFVGEIANPAAAPTVGRRAG